MAVRLRMAKERQKKMKITNCTTKRMANTIIGGKLEGGEDTRKLFSAKLRKRKQGDGEEKRGDKGKETINI